MKNKNSYKPVVFCLLFLTALVVSSCRKEVPPTPDKPATTIDLKVDPSFDWKTSKDITLNVIGLKGVSPSIGNSLIIRSSKGETIFRDYLMMDTDYSIKFTVPSTETEVLLVYGSISKSIALTSPTITFTYITEQ